MFTTNMKFEHHIYAGTYHKQGLRQKTSIVFIVQMPNLKRELPKTGTMG